LQVYKNQFNERSARLCRAFYFEKAFLVKTPDRAAMPPTKPPIKAVISSNNIHWCGKGNSWITLPANTLSLGRLFINANITHKTNIAPKPD